MKKYYSLFLATAAALAVVGCADKGNEPANHAAKVSFSEKYPQATQVEWEQKNSHYVAEFRLSQHEAEAWFDVSGKWKLTETDIPYQDLPAEVKASFESGEYQDWKVDDVDYIEREGQEPFFVLEVEKGDLEYDLYYLADGSLIKAFPDNDDDNDYLPNELPAKVEQFLTDNHPGYKIIDVDVDDGRIEVEFIDGNAKRDAEFAMDGAWISTSTDLMLADVPANIKAVLAASAYASYRVDDVEFVETEVGNYYDIELQSGSKEVDIRIHEDGTLEVIPDR
ncbi:MAG TPA: PepSY-like domain-containing protein [Parapedobacter sp.]|uniref:PepSY-like domain-containing protein n=1 Tax=Parapedobacter sp. TaxID=1958893 RepID=UPI002CCD241D|nr:PepSY-like domain-containing protein [Parapedobacter sp.]HWK56769.1 PepSY-like domain-containing protein [Parapedobacter sp.]